MGLTKELGRLAGVTVARFGGLMLVESGEAEKLLDFLEGYDVLILGIEGFFVIDQVIVPDMNAIADFSSLRSPSESVREARMFVKAVAKRDLFLDFDIKS